MKALRSTAARLAFCLFLPLLPACGDGTGPGDSSIRRIVVAPADPQSPLGLLVGGTYQLKVFLLDSADNVLPEQPVNWSSSDPATASVSSTGLVSGIAAGGVTITAEIHRLSGELRLNVLALAASLEVQAARRRELMASGAPGLGPADGVPYTPRCGLRELRATASLGYALKPRLSVFGSGAGVRFERGAAESPLTRERNTWEAGVGLAWRL